MMMSVDSKFDSKNSVCSLPQGILHFFVISFPIFGASLSKPENVTLLQNYLCHIERLKQSFFLLDNAYANSSRSQTQQMVM